MRKDLLSTTRFTRFSAVKYPSRPLLVELASIGMMLLYPVAVALLASFAHAFQASIAPKRSLFSIRAIPLELEGKLDEKKSWSVKFSFKGEEKTFDVPESMSLLEFGESVFDDVESSCRNGICTTCAARVTTGQENTLLAVNGLGAPQIEAGFVCSCQCFVVGPGVSVTLGQYEQCYERQYGQFEKSYEMKYGAKDTDDKKPESKKNIFGF